MPLSCLQRYRERKLSARSDGWRRFQMCRFNRGGGGEGFPASMGTSERERLFRGCRELNVKH